MFHIMVRDNIAHIPFFGLSSSGSCRRGLVLGDVKTVSNESDRIRGVGEIRSEKTKQNVTWETHEFIYQSSQKYTLDIMSLHFVYTK